VLLHGASGNLRDWRISVLPGLARRHHVIALDRPGFGYSDPLPGHGWRLANQVTALRAALHTLGHRNYFLVGHSYGGSLAMRWVLDHPGEVLGVLALSAPVMGWGGSGVGLHNHLGGRPLIGPVLAQLARLVAGPGWVRDATGSVFDPDAMPPEYLAESGIELALRPHSFRANAVMMLRLYGQVCEQAGRYGEIGCPVEIVHGAADTIVPATIHAIPLADIVARGRLTLLPGVGHMPHHAHPEAIIAAADRLAEQAGA